MEELLITHSQNDGHAISSFLIPRSDLSPIHLAVGLSRYNGLQVSQVKKNQITLSNGKEIVFGNNPEINLRLVAGYFDREFNKETLIEEHLKTIKYEGEVA